MADEPSSNQVLGVAVGVGVIVVSIVLYRLTRKNGKSSTGSQCNISKNSKGDLITLLDPQTKYSLKLIEKEEISHDTRRFRFALPGDKHVLGLPVGQHIHLSANVDGELVIRSYTPVSSDDDRGFMDLVVKVYFKDVHPRFPEGGKMTQHLESLAIGDTIDVRGPSGRLQYLDHGRLSVKKLRKDPATVIAVKKIAMIAGGTGITPMLQLIRHVLKTPGDDTQLSLLYANQTENDILCRKELEECAAQRPEQFKLWYTVDTPPEKGWKYSSGYITEEMLRQHLWPPSDDMVVLMCGPPPMVNYACIPNLNKIGYKQDLYFAY